MILRKSDEAMASSASVVATAMGTTVVVLIVSMLAPLGFNSLFWHKFKMDKPFNRLRGLVSKIQC